MAKENSSATSGSKGMYMVENASVPARVMRQPSLNLDDYLSIALNI
jgi:hypothetical protein